MDKPSNFGEQVFEAIVTNDLAVETLQRLLDENPSASDFDLPREAVIDLVAHLKENSSIMRFFDRNVPD